MLETFKKYHVDFLVSAATLVASDKEEIAYSSFEIGNTRAGFWHNLISTSYIGACMAFRSEVLKRVLPISGNLKYIAHSIRCHKFWLVCKSVVYIQKRCYSDYWWEEDVNDTPGLRCLCGYHQTM